MNTSPTPEQIAQFRRSADNLISAADSLERRQGMSEFSASANVEIPIDVATKIARRSADNLLMAADLTP